MNARGLRLQVIHSALAALTLLIASSAAAGGLSGAIFTTDVTGTFVNGNVYDFKGDVYLNGGPRPNAPCTAAGLPDDDYVFLVTDPSGSVLLSTDGVSERTVTVTGGVIVAYKGMTHSSTVSGKCGSITVGVAPFADTPNPDGVYKVWMTPASDYAVCECFAPSRSKTDNFKVVAPEADVPTD